MDEFMNLKY